MGKLIKFEKNSYDPGFVEKIVQGREDIKNGKGVKIDTKDLWNFQPDLRAIPFKKP